MPKREYYVEMPLTGYATGTVIAESEDEAISIFAEECTSNNIEWGVDASNATAQEGEEVQENEDE